MAEKQKKVIRPNEGSFVRWLLTVVVGTAFGIILSMPLVIVEQMSPHILAGTPFGFMSEQLFLVASFIPLFLGMMIALRLVAKTPLRKFIFGEGERIGKKTGLIILGLFLLGLVLSVLISISSIRASGVRANQFLLHFAAMLLLVWIQTTYEEIVFRGVFIRYACGNDIRMSRKAVIMGFVSSALFMIAHFANPEILTQSGLQVVAAALAYFITGMGMYFVNIHFRSMLPGILIHWLNNMIAFVFICNEVSAGQKIALFVDSSSTTGIYVLVSTALVYVPLYIYIAVRAIRRKKAA